MNWLRYSNQGATRNRPLSDQLVGALGFLPEMGVSMEVFSGGQPAKGSGKPRVGSVRHDHGNAADVFFYKDGRRLNWANEQDLPLFEEIVQKGKAAGLTGFGAGPNYMRQGSMHLGYGAPAVWGAKGRSANAPGWLRNAYYGAPASSSNSNEAAAVTADILNPTSNDQETQDMSNINFVPMQKPTSPEEIERRQMMADLLQQRSNNAGPIAHPLQGAAKMSDAIFAGLIGKKNAEDRQSNNQMLAEALFGGSGTPQNLSNERLNQVMALNPELGAQLYQQQMQAQRAQEASAQQRAYEEQQWQQRNQANNDEWTRRQQWQLDNSAPAKPTDDMREYEAAKQQGFEGSLQDWILSQRKAGASSVSVNTGDTNFKVPPGYMRDPQDAGRVTPIPGGPQDAATPTSTNRTQGVRVNQAAKALSDGFDAYEKLIDQYGAEIAPGTGKDALLAARRDLQLQMKELYNLGVLNGPDLKLMDEQLFDPTNLWTAGANEAMRVFGGDDVRTRAKANIKQLREQFERMRSAYGGAGEANGGGGETGDVDVEGLLKKYGQ